MINNKISIARVCLVLKFSQYYIIEMLKSNLVKGLILILNLFPIKIQAFRKFHDHGVEVILALENENVTMECTSDITIAYCAFLHPSEKRYSYKGHVTNVGGCSIKITATMNYAGEWRCHIGQSVGVETMKIIQLRVVNEIAAIQKNITAVHGIPMTISCTTTRGFIPLSYCRFEPPKGLAFSIDSSVTHSNPLLHRYYFPVNKSLDRGDCAVTIHKVKYEDIGVWSCGAGLDDGKEYIDVINFDVQGFYAISTEAIIGITIGVFCILGVLSMLGYAVWTRRHYLGSHDIPLRTRVLQQRQSSHIEEVASAEAEEAFSQQETPDFRTWQLPQIVVQSPTDPSGPSSPLTASTE